ncbi:MAG: glycosyltransferase family 2 protein [Clostridia bacterium]|nr:glycosyltransferase family 2 protein [Clostridia bacterium]
MPVKIKGNEPELRHFRLSVESIKNQTDPDWILIMVDDFSNDEKVSEALESVKNELKEKAHIIRLDKNVGAGMARNVGIRYADGIGAPFVVFNDSDDISHPRRLELVRKKFENEDTNVVYLSFDVIDENDRVVSEDEICLSVREIILGHHKDVIEGEDAWIGISTKKNYTNLTSCTAVRTSLAVQEPFPMASVSEDSHTWLRYAAHPGKFAFIDEIINHYRICSAVESRSRGQNLDFYLKKAAVDTDGFEKAMAISRSFGRIKPGEENPIRVAFYVREALSMLYGDSDACAGELLGSAVKISKESALRQIDLLDCKPEYKDRMKTLVAQLKSESRKKTGLDG